jgi:uncharacterized protein
MRAGCLLVLAGRPKIIASQKKWCKKSMIKRSGAVLTVAFSIGLLAPALQCPVHAQSADLVLCDRLAADPGDPDKPKDVKGTPAIAATDIETAIRFCKIASASSRRALFELGRAYAANQQLPEAIGIYRKAIDKGSTAAMVELGVLYGTGTGVAKDQAAARKLFERAAEGGNARGATNLAALSGGGGAPVDPAAARAVLSGGAEANSAEAQFQLGIMAANGTGGPQDDTAARALFEKAAAQNHPGALEWMGAFALLGRGGPKDEAAAKSYYSRAAALGNEDAKLALKRIECPYVMKDKRGNVITNLCF